MTRRERFLRTVERREVDRPACWLGMPVPEALEGLFAHFGVSDMEGLKRAIGDDVWAVDAPYRHPPSNHIACAFDFAKKEGGDYAERTLTAPGFFEDCADPARVDGFDWPDPERHMCREECRKAVQETPDGFAVMAVLWSAHFQDAFSAFGMESALVTMLTAPEMFEAVTARIVEFYLKANALFYEAAGDRLDAVLIGNDFGSQTGLMVSPEALRRFALPGTKALVDQAKAQGLKVVHHSCGAVREIIPDLIEMGVDVIHPMQALAVGMDAEGLRRDFGDRVAFCGGVDAQELLVKGRPEDVRRRAVELKRLFPTGLVVSPSHEAVLPDIPPANVAALFAAVRE